LPTKYNHKKILLETEAFKKLHLLPPGTIVQFKYKGIDIFDKKPIVLVLYSDNKQGFMDGINLHYVSEHVIHKLFAKLQASKMLGSNIVKDQIKDRKSNIDIDYYRLDLSEHGWHPSLKHNIGTQQRVGKKLYERIIKPIKNVNNAYRTYSFDKIPGGKAQIIYYKWSPAQMERFGN
jgi:hypothetical protein